MSGLPLLRVGAALVAVAAFALAPSAVALGLGAGVIWAAAFLSLVTMAICAPPRPWAAYWPPGLASAVWGLVFTALPEPPGWWVLLLGLWLAGALGIVLRAAALLARDGPPTCGGPSASPCGSASPWRSAGVSSRSCLRSLTSRVRRWWAPSCSPGSWCPPCSSWPGRPPSSSRAGGRGVGAGRPRGPTRPTGGPCDGARGWSGGPDRGSGSARRPWWRRPSPPLGLSRIPPEPCFAGPPLDPSLPACRAAVAFEGVALVLVLATLALVGADRAWTTYLGAGLASAVWGLVLAALPDAPGWWVLLLGLWLAGALGIVLWAAALLARDGPPTLWRALGLSLWLALPLAPAAGVLSWVSEPAEERALALAALPGAPWVLVPAVLLLVWLASRTHALRRGSA